MASSYNYLKFHITDVLTSNGARPPVQASGTRYITFKDLRIADGNGNYYTFPTEESKYTWTYGDGISEPTGGSRVFGHFTDPSTTDDYITFGIARYKTFSYIDAVVDLSSNSLDISIYNILSVWAATPPATSHLYCPCSFTISLSEDGVDYTEVVNVTECISANPETITAIFTQSIAPSPPVPSTISKVVYGDRTLIDLTADTVTASSLISGETAHDASGSLITGTAPKLVITNDGTTPPSDTNALWVYPDDMQDLSEVEY